MNAKRLFISKAKISDSFESAQMQVQLFGVDCHSYPQRFQVTKNFLIIFSEIRTQKSSKYQINEANGHFNNNVKNPALQLSNK